MALVRNFIKFKKFLFANTENVIFSISTTITSVVLVLCSLYTFFLVFSGGFMTCVVPDDGQLAPIVSKFCFNARSKIGNTHNDIDKLSLKHNMYIWTPYILLVQAILFYLPKFILKQIERNTFKLAMVSFVNVKTPSREKREEKFLRAYNDFLDRLLARHHFSLGPIFCEIINIVVITFQIYFMKMNLGTKFYEDTYSGNPFDKVFPKSMQCAYHGVERNGTITNNVATCDMPINYANEIIYTYLWISANLLMGLTTLVIFYRLLSMHLYCRCNAFNRFEFERACTGPVKQGDLMVVAIWGFQRWLTIRRLAKQLTGEEFSLLVNLFERQIDIEATYDVSSID